MSLVFYITLFLISASEIVCRNRNNRLLLQDDASLVAFQTYMAIVKQTFQTLEAELKALKATVANLQSASGNSAGSIYVRWGKSSCPGNGTTSVYTGYSAGSSHDASGGASNYICLPPDPQWAHYEDGTSSGGKVYGVEYQFGQYQDQGSAFLG
ncbi:uncharacterized protein LOC132715731, partial [Ruditapes philippinarum]|uniref:uncharacterized protein LOC132715731 n=1 Tax=Ruditapes philippinarum TaxID=129788 RepID=UPI00295B2FAF